MGRKPKKGKGPSVQQYGIDRYFKEVDKRSWLDKEKKQGIYIFNRFF
jgi:hypothetical protein